jgi:RNA polymerase sigma factor (sigma-70 family)
MLTKPDHVTEKTHEGSNGAKSLDETVLWDNFKNGNELAFSILYKRYIQRLYNYGMHNCRDKDLVLDCVQELFTHLWERRETVSSVGSVNFYLLKSLRRLIASKVAAQKKFFNPFPKNASHHFEFIPSVEQFLIDGEFKSQQAESLRNGMKALSKRQREALFLKFYNELSYHEVASIMEVRVDSVYNLISKAIDTLRHKLKRSTVL